MSPVALDEALEDSLVVVLSTDPAGEARLWLTSPRKGSVSPLSASLGRLSILSLSSCVTAVQGGTFLVVALAGSDGDLLVLTVPLIRVSLDCLYPDSQSAVIYSSLA